MMATVICKRLLSYKPLAKKFPLRLCKHNAFTSSPVCNTRIAYYCTQHSANKVGVNPDAKDGANSKLERSESNLPAKRKLKHNTLIEPTKYYNPVFSDKENFEEKFWAAYQDKIRLQKQDMQEYPDRIRYRKVYNNPIERTIGVLKDDILEYFGRLKRNPLVYIRNPMLDIRVPEEEQIFPYTCDVLIIGGGIVGTSVAFHVQERARDGLRVVVVEKDLSYSKSSTLLSDGGIRQQFSTPENIILSKYGMDFLQQADTRLLVQGYPPPDVDLTFNGHLTLANEEGYSTLKANYEVQRTHGSFVEMLTKTQLQSRFPWLNTEGVEVGVYGVQREGWFDPWSFLLALNRKTKELGTEYVNGTVTDCTFKACGDIIRNREDVTEMKHINSVQVTLPSGDTRDIKCAACVIAAGAWSNDVGRILGVGVAPSGMNSIPIPVEPRKRYVYCVKSPNGPSLNCPMVIDTTGAYFRREGLADLYVCGRPPLPEEEPANDNLSVDYNYFEKKIWPAISNRCPSFKNLQVHSSWAGYYDYNTFDQNAIIGRHPMFNNLYIGTGFTGHGIQQAAGAGCAISELILDVDLKTLKIENLGFERVLAFNPIVEKYCY